MDERARRHLPQAARHPGGLGHGGHGPGHGVRQHGGGLRHRRRLHPRPLHRGGGALRRIPGQRARRGRGGRHPHAARGERGGARGERHRGAGDGTRHARCLRRIAGGHGTARASLPRHAGCRVHGAARHALDPPDPGGQAHRQGGAEDRRRHGARGAGERGGGADAGGPARAGAVAPPHPRPGGAAPGAGARPAGLAGCGLRQGRLRRRRGRGPRRAAARP